MSDWFDKLIKLPPEYIARILADKMEAEEQSQSNSSTKHRHDLGNGISIYKQKYSQNWYCRIHQPKNNVKDYRQSTQKSDLQAAKLEAIRIGVALEMKLNNGVQIKKGITFKTISKIIIEKYQKRNKSNDKYYISVINNYALPFFGEMEIVNINDRSIRLFWNKYCLDREGNPSQTFVTTMNVVLKAILLEAKEQSLISSLPILEKKVDVKKSRRGKSWDDQEITIIFQKLDSWVSSENNKEKKENKELLILYCKFLSFTGIRTGDEALEIEYGDLRKTQESGKTDYYCKIRKGKLEETVKSERDVLIAKGGESSRVIMEVLTPLAKKMGFKGLSDAMENGKKRKLFEIKRPNELWKSFSTKNNIEGTLYKFRHTYITNEVLDGIPYPHIAAQVGNSVKVIEDYYNHSTPELIRRRELRNQLKLAQKR